MIILSILIIALSIADIAMHFKISKDSRNMKLIVSNDVAEVFRYVKRDINKKILLRILKIIIKIVLILSILVYSVIYLQKPLLALIWGMLNALTMWGEFTAISSLNGNKKALMEKIDEMLK